MDIAQIADLQQRIAADLVANAPEGWERLEASIVCVAGVATTDIQARLDGSSRRFRAMTATIEFPDLQVAMYTPDKGTWFSATCAVEPPGSFSYSFNYDEEPQFEEAYEEPLEESWVKELRRHPRPWALIPGWHPVRRNFTEDEWAADLASHED